MIRHTLIAAALLALAACSRPSDPDACIREADRAMAEGNYEKACALYTEAVRSLQRTDERFFDASLGLVEALIDEDPEKAGREFQKLIEAFPRRVTEKNFVDFSGRLVSSGKYPQAIHLLESGIERFGGQSPRLNDQLERVKREAAEDTPVILKLRPICSYGETDAH